MSSAPRRTARPSSGGILRSVSTTSNGSDRSRESADSALSASATSYPACRSTRAVVVRMFRWSSTIKTRDVGVAAGPGAVASLIGEGISQAPGREKNASLPGERQEQVELGAALGVGQQGAPSVAFGDALDHRQAQP